MSGSQIWQISYQIDKAIKFVSMHLQKQRNKQNPGLQDHHFFRAIHLPSASSLSCLSRTGPVRNMVPLSTIRSSSMIGKVSSGNIAGSRISLVHSQNAAAVRTYCNKVYIQINRFVHKCLVINETTLNWNFGKVYGLQGWKYEIMLNIL